MSTTRQQMETLHKWAINMAGACQLGYFGKRMIVKEVRLTNGPRIGAIDLVVGLASPILLKKLKDAEMALTRQFIPWAFQGDPQVRMNGRTVRIEVGWPQDWQTNDIKLSKLRSQMPPVDSSRWVAGVNNHYVPVTCGLNDNTSHWLLAGQTGSGKTEALRSAATQLAQNPENRLLLIDCKDGDGLGFLENLKGVIGPCCVEISQMRNALGMITQEMVRRYRSGSQSPTTPKIPRIVVVIDEVQTIASEGEAKDPTGLGTLLANLLYKGRGAGIHFLTGTSNPNVDAFKFPAMRRALAGRVALRVEDPDSSKMILHDSNLRADQLLGQGDSYCQSPQATARTQLAWIPPDEMKIYLGYQPRLKRYPVFDAEKVGEVDNLPESSVPSQTVIFSPKEEMAALVAAHHGKRGLGRPKFMAYLKEKGLEPGGSSRIDKLMKRGRAWRDELSALGYIVNEIS